MQHFLFINECREPLYQKLIHPSIARNILCFLVFIFITYVLYFELFLCAAPGNTMKMTGNVDNYFKIIQGVVRLARIVMMFCAGILGVIVGIMWFMGQQQAQGMLHKYFVAVFFIFGATVILDAMLYITVGDIAFTAPRNTNSGNPLW